MADRTVVISPIGGDYANLGAAVAGEVSANHDLTADNGSGSPGSLAMKIQGDWSAGADTSLGVINGFVTNLSCYLLVYTDAANRATASGWQNTRYRMSKPTSTCISIQDNFVWLDGIQVETPSINSAGEYPVVITAIDVSNYIRLSNMRIRGASDNYSQSGIRLGDSDIICDIWNVIVENVSPGNAGGLGINLAYGSVVRIFNSLVKGCHIGISRANGTVSATNLAVFNNVDDFLGTITVDHCASDDDDGTNNVAESGGGYNWSADFFDAASGDFRLKDHSGLVRSAIVDPGSGLFSDDIEGATRDALWDVGPYKLTGGDPPGVPFARSNVMIVG